MGATHDEDDRLGELFEHAVRLPRSERSAYLARECPEDDTFRAELESLLASHDTAPDFLERLGHAVLPPALEALDEDFDPVGETVGHYAILGVLGRGGMGAVFHARDRVLGRDVALKFLPAHLAADAAATERLKEEARVASALDHPHIAVVYEVGTAPRTPSRPVPRAYIAMAFCGEETLADELARAGRLSLARALDCGLQLADALSSAHEAGIVHRDVKPANLIVGARGALKLVDFGLSTRAGDRATEGGRGGTVAYTAPEQLSGAAVDHRADIWATGVVLYELLSGSRPFRGGSAERVAFAICHEQPEPLAERRPDVPARLAAVVHRCLAKDPATRYASATALLTDLRTAADVAGGGSASLVVVPFENASGDPGVDYLCDGFTDEVITELARTPALRVLSGASARRLKHVERSPEVVASELGVDYALAGGLRADGGRLRIEASLLEAGSGARRWSVALEGDGDALQRMRTEVARGVLGNLDLPAGRVAFGAANPSLADARAYEAFLRARHEAWRFSREGFENARRYLAAALAIVGDDDLLHGTLGHVTAMQAESGLRLTPGVEAEVEACAARVFALNPRSARGHWLRSWAAFRRGDLRAAIRSGEHAHALDSDDPDTLLILAYLYIHAGRNADGRALFERALLLDPLTPLTQALPGFAAVMEGRFADAVTAYRRALELDPASQFFATFLGWSLGYDGRLDEAARTLHAVADRFPGTLFAPYAHSLAHGLLGERDPALRAITPELEQAARDNEMFARELAHCLALAGEHDRALDSLERAVDLGMWNLTYLAEHDRFLDGLRSERRFQALLERVRAEAADLRGISSDPGGSA